VLAFEDSSSTGYDEDIVHLIELKKRFKDQPLAILALHDASITSLAKYKEALAPLRTKLAGEIPIRFLLDRPPIGAGRGPYALYAGEEGSGRTRDTYEIDAEPGMYVIDKNGKLVYGLTGVLEISMGKEGQLVRDYIETEFTEDGKVDRIRAIDHLEGALEDQFGLARTPHPARPTSRPPMLARPILENLVPGPMVSLAVKGKVVDLDGKPIVGAKVTEQFDFDWKNAVKTGPTGDFTYNFQGGSDFGMKLNAPGFVSRVFNFSYSSDGKPQDNTGISIGPSGVIPGPLIMGPGVTVTGRVIDKGVPAAGVLIRFAYQAELDKTEPREFKTITDNQGRFRIAHAWTQTEFSAYAEVGSLKDHGTIIPRRFRSGEDGSTTDLGDLESRPGLTLAGKVVLPDGSTPPQDSLVEVSPEYAGSWSVKPDGQGRFEVKGLPEGPVTVRLRSPTDEAPTLSYHLSPKNKCLNPTLPDLLSGHLNQDITDLTILVEPGMRRISGIPLDVGPAVLADFYDAESGPITGVPPKDFAKGR
jgi:hypothetical protein